MAITENAFTPEELGAAITANPALQNIVTGFLTEKKFVVHDEDTHKNYLEQYKQNEIAPVTSELAKNVEKDVLELTGIQKASPDEKYYDYLKRAFGSVKTELTELKSKRNPSEADKQRIEQLEAAIATEKNNYSEALKKKDDEIFSLKTGNLISVSMGKAKEGKTYKPGFTPEVVAMVEQTAVADLQRRLKYQDDGTPTIIGDDGKVILNTSTYKPLTPEEYLGSKLAPAFDDGKQQGGAGSGGNGGNEGGNDSKFTGLPAEVKTKVQLTDHLKRLGILEDSAEFNKIFAEHGQNLPLR